MQHPHLAEPRAAAAPASPGARSAETPRPAAARRGGHAVGLHSTARRLGVALPLSASVCPPACGARPGTGSWEARQRGGNGCGRSFPTALLTPWHRCQNKGRSARAAALNFQEGEIKTQSLIRTVTFRVQAREAGRQTEPGR